MQSPALRGTTLPTYEYQCAKCRKVYELRESFSAPTTHTCQECGKGQAKRVLHAPRVVFKGSGWYVTDSRSKSSAIADSGPETSSEGDGSKAEPAAAEKPAPKAEKKSKAGSDSASTAAAG